MKDYELVLVTSTDGDGENLKKEILDEVKSTLEKEKGKLGKVDEWTRRELAYPIKKEKAGVYTIVFFSAPSSVPGNLSGKLRLMESLLRFLLVEAQQMAVEN